MRAALLLFLTGSLLLAGLAPAEARRVALIVGNSQYTHVPRLTNPANDARLIAGTLEGLGFTLVGGGPNLDLDKAAFDKAVQEFGRQIEGAEVALFYYAGHGLQVDGANYLAPVDANPTRAADADFQMLNANLVLRQMEASGARLNVMILDACRNNPFAGSGMRAAGGGLAQMQAPEGTLISFATQPGNVALDGADGDSPYSKALAATLRKPGLDIFRTFNEVGLAVSSATGGQQQPWLSTSPIKGDFYFAGNAADKQPQGGTSPGASQAVDAGKLAALQSKLAELERKLDSRDSQPDATQPATSPPGPQTPGSPYDGKWKVSVGRLTGCRGPGNISFFVRVDQGVIDEPRQRNPKKGSVSADGHFSIEVFTPGGGRRLNTQTGTLNGKTGEGKFVGGIPSCTGKVHLTKVN